MYFLCGSSKIKRGRNQARRPTAGEGRRPQADGWRKPMEAAGRRRAKADGRPKADGGRRPTAAEGRRRRPQADGGRRPTAAEGRRRPKADADNCEAQVSNIFEHIACCEAWRRQGFEIEIAGCAAPRPII